MCLDLEEANYDLFVKLRQCMFVVAAFLSIISIYIVLKHSSQSLKNYKNVLLLHLICFLLHDCLSSLMITWRSYPTMLAFRQMGLLTYTSIPLYIALVPLGGVVTEILGLYHYMILHRTQTLLPNGHFLKFRGKGASYFRFISYNTWLIGVAFVLLVFTSDEELKLEQLKEFDVCKNFEKMIQSKDVVILNYRWSPYATFSVCVCFVYMISAYLTSFCLSVGLTKGSRKIMSDKTKQNHRILLMSLFHQTFVPLTLMIVPTVIMYVGKNMVTEQIAMFFYSYQGISNTFSLLIAHRDYRLLLKEWASRFVCFNQKSSPSHSDQNSRNQA